MDGVGVRSAPRLSPADTALLRRADAAGQRLFRELVVSRIAWASVMEASRLAAVDMVGFSLRTGGCEHPQPCDRQECVDRFQMKALVGNRGRGAVDLHLQLGLGVTGRAITAGRPVALADVSGIPLPPDLTGVVLDEGLVGIAAVPVSFGGEVRAVLHLGLRHPGGFPAATIEAFQRMATYAGAALAAARDRLRVEEVAALRERRRLARALHDELGQRLFGIGVSARLVRESAASGGADLITRIHRVEQQVEEATTALRTTLRRLDTPHTPAGVLAVQVREDLAAFGDRTGCRGHLLVIGDPEPLDGDRTDLLVQAVQEGLRNIERHANASEVVVTLGFGAGVVEAALQDDGTGPTAGRGEGFGLRTLARDLERVGGTVRLGRGEESGAILRVRVPVGP